MNFDLLLPEVQEFITRNESKDIHEIALKKSPFKNILSSELAQQIKGKKVAKGKFPTLYKTANIFYPPSLNLEQTSSEVTANYKAKILKGNTLIDLTAGFGIDDLAFSHSFKKVIRIEKDQTLHELAQHNFKTLERNNIHSINADFNTYLSEFKTENYSAIYVDPSRRLKGEKKFILSELTPNILTLLNIFKTRAEEILIKLSPLVDLTLLINEIPNINNIHCVAVNNEMKEVLVHIINSKTVSSPQIIAVNLNTNQTTFSFTFSEEEHTSVNLSSPKNYIYEPNVALLKSNGFKQIAWQYKLDKLHPNTHLYTQENIIEHFPGKIFKIIKPITDTKKEINKKAFHVLVKNFPQKTEIIKKKYQLKESMEQSLIFTQSLNGKHILLSKKIN